MINWINIIALILLASNCGRQDMPERDLTLAEKLSRKYQEYQLLARDQQDPVTGFVYSDDCDSLLFSALTGTVVGPIDIRAAESDEESGKWFRRDRDHNYCYDRDLKRGTDISRDMFTGLIYYAITWERRDILEGIFEYGKENNWIMGRERDPFETRNILSPNLIGLVARGIYFLGGESHSERLLPKTYDTQPGFPSHLSMIRMLSEARISGGLGWYARGKLREILKHMGNNPLPHAILGHYTRDGEHLDKAAKLLLETWPDGRLPTSDDWCEQWRIQRSDGDTGFQPCSEFQTHSGGDFLLAAAITLGDFRNLELNIDIKDEVR